eukprot:11274034-Heterocapsa_arctica.AAC.1
MQKPAIPIPLSCFPPRNPRSAGFSRLWSKLEKEYRSEGMSSDARSAEGLELGFSPNAAGNSEKESGGRRLQTPHT